MKLVSDSMLNKGIEPFFDGSIYMTQLFPNSVRTLTHPNLLPPMLTLSFLVRHNCSIGHPVRDMNHMNIII